MRTVVSWVLRLIAAAILLQTLFFKFTGAPESVYIFSALGMEPWGRIGTGVAELVAAVLLLAPPTVALGALLALGLMGGALVSHLTRLGIVVLDDGGLLFGLALAVFACSAILLYLHRTQIPVIGDRWSGPHRHAGGGGAGGPLTSWPAPGSPRTDPTRRILVLGGGFGGVYTALELDRALRPQDRVGVTLVNRENFFLFTPLLHEVAASDVDLTNIVSPVRKLLRRVDFFEGEVVGIDLPRRQATLRHGSDGHEHTVEWDSLVIALGSITNYFNLPGLAERAMTMKSLGDAMHLRNRMIANLEEADTECARAIREPLMTYVVAGGGFAGVETIAGMNDFLREALPYYPHLSEDDVRVVLVHPGEFILPELGEKLGRYAQRKLAQRGVEIRTGTRVAGVSNDSVQLTDGTFIRTRALVWTAGTSPHTLLAALPCEKERGRLRVDEFLEVPGFPGVFALGDCAAIPDPRTGGHHPPTAQHALREARVAARNVLARLRGGPVRPFRFSTLGQLAAIGRRTGVARMFGLNFSGFLAWWLWRTVYLSKLPRLEKKLRVMLDWTLDLVFSKDLVQFLTERAPTVSHVESVAEPPETALHGARARG
jgi:NADH dehydrogenase